MAFWKKKSEDPWDMDPNRKRKPVMYYEREIEPQPEPIPRPAPQKRSKEDEGLAMPAQTVESAEQEPQEDAPDCPWCGGKMVRAYIVGGRDRPRLTDRKPTAFLGILGYETLDFSDDGFLTTHKSCWQCKPCRKVVADIPEPLPKDSFACWDGNPVAPPSSGEIEE